MPSCSSRNGRSSPSSTGPTSPRACAGPSSWTAATPSMPPRSWRPDSRTRASDAAPWHPWRSRENPSMQAVILVGGEGTRLRPLTSTVPKPVVPLVDRPFIAYMLEWLRAHDVDDVVMSCGFLATSVRNVLGDGSAFGLRLRFVEEPEPRGTAGALKYAEDLLDERFLMLNGDVLTDIDLTAQLAQHEATGAVGTLALVPVEDPSAYGLVRTDDDHSVREFVEKPTADSIDTNLISAGAYVLERRVLDLIPPDRNVSIEREIWPRLVGAGLFAFAADAYWLDIGTPERYLQATFDILEGNVQTAVTDRLGAGFVAVGDNVETAGRIVPPAVVERGCRIAEGAHVGSLVVLGDGVSVGEGSKIERSVVLNGSQIGPHCTLQDCIVAAGVRIGEGTVVSGGAVLGEGVTVGERNVLSRGVRVFPQTELPDGAITF